jgi:MFS family permease
MTDAQGSAFISVMSATNFVGRLLAGVLADKFGNLNSNLLFHLIAALSCLLIWTFAETYGTFMAFSAVFGLSSGSYFALMSPISASILGMEKFPTGLSFLFLANALPIFGTNISSAIQTNVSTKPFFAYKMFAGVAFLLGFFILLILRFRLNRKIFAKV